jgi:hypothetical protein
VEICPQLLVRNPNRKQVKMYKEQVQKIIIQREKGFITDTEMWQAVGRIADWALDDLEANGIHLGINEGIAR